MLFRSQTEITPPILPLVISSSDPFADISQAAKGSASLVVTPSSIPDFATCGPDLDLSSEWSADIFEDPDDVPVLKRTISDSDEEDSASFGPDLMGMYLPSSSSSLFFFCICASFAYSSLHLQKLLKDQRLQQVRG